MTVDQLISASIIPLRKTDAVSFALTWMDDHRVNHLPVVDGSEYLGMVVDEDISGVEDKAKKLSELYGYLHKPFIVEGEHYYNALQLLIEQKLSLLPVLDQRHNYLGVITREKILDEMAGSLSVQNPGGIIVLELNQNDYSLSEISRIVESNDAIILSLNVKSIHGSRKLEITLKLNRINIEAIIQSFERYNYEIKAYFGENQKDDDLLRERYDSLLTYLKI
jgi:predicted transcriptional regulator